MRASIKEQILLFSGQNDIAKETLKHAKALYISGQCQLLSQSKERFDFWVADEFADAEISIVIQEIEAPETPEELEEQAEPSYIISALKNGKSIEWEKYSIACLMQLDEELDRLDEEKFTEGKKYTREGMVKRVMEERRERAKNAEYRIEYADNIYGEHILTNERGIKYRITLRDFENEAGYVNNMDMHTNKLGTTKHLMFAFDALKSNKRRYNRLKKVYPFVEIYLDPLNDYQITWFYPHELNQEIQQLLEDFFQGESFIPHERTRSFLSFLNKAHVHKEILIRPEVREKIERAYEEQVLEDVQEHHQIDYSLIKADLFDYQKEGIEFITYKKGVILADEMGLGKTMQAIASALMKKKIFDFKRALIICPASLKHQWKSEIEKFSDETAVVIEGKPEERIATYRNAPEYFRIANYETVLRDQHEMNKYPADLIILDEAQRIKNYTTRTSHAIKALKRKHSLILTGTPIENKLTDLYSLVAFIDPYFLAPLWEFSYQYCYFDHKQKNRITGYYNLQELNERLKPILLRREKRNVIKQLPKITQRDVFVNMHPMQGDYHASYAKSIAQIVGKKFMTPYDMQRLMLLMANMRMVCDSTYLIDHDTNHSPKLDELEHILTEKMDLQHADRKIIIFSEWTRMNMLIGQLLKKHNIAFAELNGKVPVKHRKKLIEKFENDPKCKVFVSTEAGGTGLNLQVADTVINFELPWNPAKKNQRIGRIDRVGQRSENLTVLNFITRDSIEMRIASGLMLKQNLFEGVLDTDSHTDSVDFSSKGRSQFLQQLESMIDEFQESVIEEVEVEEGFAKELADLGNETTDHQDETETEDTPEATTEAPNENEIPSEGTPSSESSSSSEGKSTAKTERTQQLKDVEQVMNQGMGFLSGLFKMATGKEMGAEGAQVDVNQETGEVTLKFKLPSL